MAANTTIGQKQSHHLEPPDNGSARPNSKHLANSVINYSKQIDEIATSLRKKEEELRQRPGEADIQDLSFNHLLLEYSQHDKYMTELCEYCHTIIRAKEEGQELRDNESLSDEERDEVGIRMDAMLVFYDRLKILATDRLQMLQRTIDGRQRSKIERLEKWLSTVESRLASLNNIGPDYDAIQRQLNDVRELRNELEQKQEFVDFISKVIIFDDVDSESLQLHNRSAKDLDEQLEKLDRRWTQICQFVNDRHEKLKKAEAIWKVLSIEGPQLYAWLKQIQTDLNELSDATQNVTNFDVDKTTFIMKLVTRSDKVEQAIKKKQSFYTSLENRVRVEMEQFDDPCSMLVIELEKKLEDMQDNWNSIMRQKRMIDFSLQALSDPQAATAQNDIAPQLRGPIISTLNNSLSSIKDLPTQKSGDNPNGDGGCIDDHVLDILSDPLTMSSSAGNEDKESSLQFNGSLLSDPSKSAFDTSFSSQDAKSISNNNDVKCKYNNDNEELYHDENSTATNLTSPQTTTDGADNVYVESANDLAGSFQQTISNMDFQEHLFAADQLDRVHDNVHGPAAAGEHNCRVEEWKHSLESFLNWLRQVEVSLEIECAHLEGHANDNPMKIKQGQVSFTWSGLDIQNQLELIKSIERRIRGTCQDEFDCLFLQGQQIFEDLMPEIGENEYEANLKEILADLEMRYSVVKRCLANRKLEFSDGDRWRQLVRKLRDMSNYIINQMGEVTPETEIGVDLITLAQQQDHLMRLKQDAENNPMVNDSIQATKSFLKAYDLLQQQYGQQNINFNNHHHQQQQFINDDEDFEKIWISFKEFKEIIEDQLDRLQLHHSELLQLILDRLSRLDEVHKEMHELQHSIQDLATKLQVAEILRSNWVPLDNLSIEQLSEQLEDLKLYRERLSEFESNHRMMNSIVDWMEQFGSPLSKSNLKRIEELNNIWQFIQSSSNERQKQIEQAFDEQSGSEQKFLVQTVADLPGKWERRVATNSKVPYFIDHNSNKNLWDHPKFTNLLNSLNECKQYVYSVYRTAMKICLIQKGLGIDKLMLENLKEIFIALDIQLGQQKQQKSSSSNKDQQLINNEAPVGVEQIILLLKVIFTKIRNEESPSLDIPVAIDLTLNWLLNLYDSTRTGFISALSLKVGLTLICCATREEKYIYMFELVANRSSGTVDARKLGTLFEICMRLPIYLGEHDSFGTPDLIETSIRNCFSMSKFNPQHPNCINMEDYLNWLKTEPQFIVWLPVLHRILISENTIHSVKCQLCGSNPIIGLRYRCLKCFKFNICQRCFLTGRHIYEHFDPNKHQMQEYCFKTSAGENVRDLTKILRNKINPKASRNIVSA